MKKQFIQPETLAKPGVYTPVVTVHGGKTIYISGQVAQDAAGKLASTLIGVLALARAGLLVEIEAVAVVD